MDGSFLKYVIESGEKKMAGNKKTLSQQQKRVKMIHNQNIGRMKKKHSKMGMVSCMFAGAAFLFLSAAVMITFFELNGATALVGGFGVCSIILTFMGIKASMKGRKEKDKRYLTCNIGVILNILLLIGLVIIYTI